ncbi:hypothetical protein EV421DRAFT_424699 [Armillaria borealis]|uniref:Protein kinase domain-containing protein n=1 Tax=Armillaria borealis TaxID=47425 RepID=A0AA39N1Z7_9AGAR|nr:hypothetical protein EV421DRAFT_424699 [Armillaria borealis]
MAEITRESNNVDKAWNAFIVKENELVTKLEETPLFGGGFGNIHKGIYGARFVAIKELKYQTESNNGRRKIAELVHKEVGTWSSLSHKNVLALLRVCGDYWDPSSMISPWMENGTANHYLSSHPNADLSAISAA